MPMLEFRLASASSGKRLVFVPGGFGLRTFLTLDDLARHIATKRGISPRSVWKWYCRFQKHGFRALANGIRADRGRSRYFAAHPIAQQLVEKCLTERMSAREIHRTLRRELNDAAPCYGTVRAYLNSTAKMHALTWKRKARP